MGTLFTGLVRYPALIAGLLATALFASILVLAVPPQTSLAADPIELTGNGGAGPLTVPVNQAVELVATGLVADSSMSLTGYYDECGGIERFVVSQPVPMDGSFETSPSLDFPVTLAFEVSSNGETSNCVVVTWEDDEAPELRADGSLGPLQVVIGETVTLTASGVSSGGTVSFQEGEFTCNSNPAEVGSETASGGGTASTPVTIDGLGYFYFTAVADGRTSNCVIVEGIQGPIELTGNGGAGPLTVPVNQAVELVATGLVADSSMSLTGYYDECGGIQRFVVSQPVPMDGSFETSPSLDFPVTLAFEVSSNGETSNCVVVTWEDDEAPELRADGSLGPLQVVIGETVTLTASGVSSGGTVSFQEGEFTCNSNPAEVGSETASGGGTASTPVTIDGLGYFYFTAVADGRTSNCVIVEGIQGPIELTGNGGAGPLTVPVNQAVELVATGLVADSLMSLTGYYDECGGIERFVVSQPVPMDGSFETSPSLDFPVTLAFEVSSNGETSNCVVVTWEDDEAPELRADGSLGPLQVVIGETVTLTASGVSSGGTVSFQEGEFTCNSNPAEVGSETASGGGTASTPVTIDGLGYFYFTAVADGRTSNCVIVEGVTELPPESPTPTPRATRTPTATPTRTPVPASSTPSQGAASESETEQYSDPVATSTPGASKRTPTPTLQPVATGTPTPVVSSIVPPATGAAGLKTMQ